MEFRAATLADYATLFPARGRRMWRVAAVQILSGPAWTLWRAGRPRLLCGLHPLHPGVLEAWLMLPIGARPGLATLRHLLERAGTVFPDHLVVARIDDRNPAGQRLARIAGFVPLDEFLGDTTIRTWLRPSLGAGTPET
jgi:hypothetical protein